MDSQFSGARGNWPVIDEIICPTVIQQKNKLCCGAACGEMLLKSREINDIDQMMIEQLSTSPTWPEILADALNILAPNSRGRWVGNFVSVSSFDGLNLTGSWIAVLWELGDRIGHMVIVDGIDNHLVLIRDPWEGTRYKIRIPDFLQYWNGQAVYWIEQ